MRKIVRIIAAVAMLSLATGTKASAQMVTHDPLNYIQNILNSLQELDISGWNAFKDGMDKFDELKGLKELYDGAKAKVEDLKGFMTMYENYRSVYSVMDSFMGLYETARENVGMFNTYLKYFNVSGEASEYAEARSLLTAYSDIYKQLYEVLEGNINQLKGLTGASVAEYATLLKTISDEASQKMAVLTSFVSGEFSDMYVKNTYKQEKELADEFMETVFY